MKISIPFLMNNEYNDIADQFDVNIDPSKNDVNKMHEFLSVYEDKQINIHFPQGIDETVARSLAIVHPNAMFKCSLQDMRIASKLKEECEKFKFYFDFSFPCISWTAFQEQVDMGVSEIYPFDDLLYEMATLKSVCKRNHVKTRLMLNIIQSTRHDRGTKPYDAFFRPEDMTWLSQYIDTFEFYCKSENSDYSWHKFKPLYHAYFENNQWVGYLNELIPDLQMKVPNWALLPRYSYSRSMCGLSCVKRSGCRKCHNYISLAEELAEKNVRIKREEDK